MPCYKREIIKPETMHSLNAAKNSGKYDYRIVDSVYINDARNAMIANHAHVSRIDDSIPGYIFTDHDMVFTVDQLDELVGDGTKVVGAGYRMSTDKYRLVAGWWDEEKGPGWNGEFVKHDASGLIPVHWTGTGGLYCPAKFLQEEGAYPFFPVKEITCKVDDEEWSYPLRDDTSFCMKLADRGHEIFLNADIRFEHKVDEIYCFYGDLMAGKINNIMSIEENPLVTGLEKLSDADFDISTVDDIMSLSKSVSDSIVTLRMTMQKSMEKHGERVGDRITITDEVAQLRFSQEMQELGKKETRIPCGKPKVPSENIRLSVKEKMALDKFIDWK